MNYLIFSDISFNPKNKIGVGGFIIIPSNKINSISEDLITTKTVEDTKNTSLEIQAILWALETFKQKYSSQNISKLTVYTDCQTVANLLSRRKRLEEKGYRSNKGKKLSNAVLYQKFYQLYDELKPEIIWVKGHKETHKKDEIDRIFSFLDKFVRKMLRNYK